MLMILQSGTRMRSRISLRRCVGMLCAPVALFSSLHIISRTSSLDTQVKMIHVWNKLIYKSISYHKYLASFRPLAEPMKLQINNCYNL